MATEGRSAGVIPVHPLAGVKPAKGKRKDTSWLARSLEEQLNRSAHSPEMLARAKEWASAQVKAVEWDESKQPA